MPEKSSATVSLLLLPRPGTSCTLGKVGRDKSSKVVGNAQRPHGTVLFVDVSFRLRWEVNRELGVGKENEVDID